MLVDNFDTIKANQHDDYIIIYKKLREYYMAERNFMLTSSTLFVMFVFKNFLGGFRKIYDNEQADSTKVKANWSLITLFLNSIWYISMIEFSKKYKMANLLILKNGNIIKKLIIFIFFYSPWSIPVKLSTFMSTTNLDTLTLPSKLKPNLATRITSSTLCMH